MKGTHGTKWQGPTDDKMSLHSGDDNNNIIETVTDEMADEMNMEADSTFDELDALSEMNAVGIEPVLALQDETQWHGIPLQLCTLDGKKHYKCVKCMYINSNAANTANHYTMHGLKRKFSCPSCDYSVDTIKPLQNHIETIHNREPTFKTIRAPITPDLSRKPDAAHTETKGLTQFACPKCPYKTNYKMKLQIHAERHNAHSRYQCQLCDYSVDNYGYLRRHARLHNNSKPSPSQPATEEHHIEEEPSFEDQEFSDRWTTNNFPEKKSAPEKYTFRCGACPYFTAKKALILKHRINHVLKSPFACQDCTYSTDNTSELEDHVRFHGNIQPPSGHMEFIVEPTSEMYKVIEKFPDDVEEKEVQEREDMVDGDVEDDVEAAMMEEELRGTINGQDMGDKDDDNIQFRNHKCNDCPYSSNSNAEYMKHIRLHNPDKKFKCDYCSYSLDRVNLISQHRRLHFQEKNFEAAPLISKLLNKNHEEYETLLAKIGNDVAFPPVESIPKLPDEAVDVYMFHRQGDDKNKYCCNKCPYKCQAQKSFKCHLQMHGINRKYKCDYCDWSAERLNLVIQHRRVHADEVGFDPAPGELQVLNREFCLQNESTNDNTTNGMAMMDYEENPAVVAKPPKRNANGEKIFYCKLCPFKSENINTYAYHKKLHCIQAMYSCSECSYSINNLTSLNEHINLHQKERELIKASLTDGGSKHKCPKCPFSIANKNLLVNHTSMHGSGRKYPCGQCDFSCDAQPLLQLHAKVHSNDYNGSDPMEEMEHLMKRRPDVIGPQIYLTASLHDIESDESDNADPDIKCEKCPYSTPSKDELSSHTEHHNMSDKNTCMYCTYSCAKEEDLINHVQVHFPSTTVDRDLLKLLKRQSQSHKRNISKAFDDEAESQSDKKDGEPDSTTINDKTDEGPERKVAKIKDEPKEVEKTKVYVCQYCEREFDNKTTMLQHEKQHQF